jgi:hypothetical protein
MNPTRPRRRALTSPQRPAIGAGGMNTPDDPSLCGPSPTPHPNRPGNRGSSTAPERLPLRCQDTVLVGVGARGGGPGRRRRRAVVGFSSGSG